MINRTVSDFFRGTKVLIVEGDEATLRILSGMLSGLGIATETAQKFAEAAALLHQNLFHTILLACDLENEFALELLEIAKVVQPDTPVVMVAETTSLKTALEAVRCGAYDYLCKPVDNQKLCNMIRRTIELGILREETKRIQKELQRHQQLIEKLTEKQISSSLPSDETRCCKLVQFAPEPMFSLSSKGAFVFLNLAILSLTHYSKEELLNMRLTDLFLHSDTIDRLQAAMEHTGFVRNFGAKIVAKDGKLKSILITLQSIRDEEGNDDGYYGWIRNITPNKRLADRAKNPSNLLQSTANSFPHPFLVVRAADFTVKVANEAARIDSHGDTSTCHSLLYGLTQPCQEAERACIIKKIIKTKQPGSTAFQVKSDDGQISYKEAHGFPALDENGEVENIIYYILDITQQERIKRELKLVTTAVEQSIDSIVITDQNRVIQYVNTAFEAGTGYSKEEAFGESPIMMDSGRHNAEFYQELRATLREGKVWQGIFINRKKDGTLLEEETSIYPVKSAIGSITNYVSVARDVTETRRLESIVDAANLMDNIGFVFSAIRHEIGNPLNSVKMALSVLDKNLQDYSYETIDEFVKRALEELCRIEYLLKVLKSFSMHENVELSRFRIDEFIANFVTLVKDDFTEKGVQIIADLQPEAVWAVGDERALHHIFLNLVANSCDAFEEQEKPCISFELRKTGGLVHVIVSDTGKGMSSEELEKAFQPFYTSKPHGNGLGLIIVKKMLANMKSGIKIESTDHQGTSVFVSIPEAQDVEEE